MTMKENLANTLEKINKFNTDRVCPMCGNDKVFIRKNNGVQNADVQNYGFDRHLKFWHAQCSDKKCYAKWPVMDQKTYLKLVKD